MIVQGTDGTSRGDLGEGVMRGQTMMSFIPLHLTALECCRGLRDAIKNVIIPREVEEEVIFLEYEDWFQRGHDIIGGKKNDDRVWVPTYKSG